MLTRFPCESSPRIVERAADRLPEGGPPSTVPGRIGQVEGQVAGRCQIHGEPVSARCLSARRLEQDADLPSADYGDGSGKHLRLPAASAGAASTTRAPGLRSTRV